MNPPLKLVFWRSEELTLSQPITKAVCKHTDGDWLNEEEILQSDHCSQSERVVLTKPVGVCWRGSTRAHIDLLRLTGAPKVLKAQL